MAISDIARNFWDRISPRERRLVVLAAIATPITIAIWLGLSIHDGLVAREHRNDQTRKALDVMADLRARGQTKDTVDDATAAMTTEAVPLVSYINTAAKAAKYTLTSTITSAQQVKKNGFKTDSSSLSVDKITIEQLRSFLMQLETSSKVVAVTRIELHRDFHEKDKLSVNLEISAYAKDAPAPAEPAGSGATGSDVKKGS